MEAPPELLEGKPESSHATILGAWAVMNDVRLPFAVERLVAIARGEMEYVSKGKRYPYSFEASVKKVWNGKYQDNRGCPTVELELAAGYLGYYDLLY